MAKAMVTNGFNTEFEIDDRDHLWLAEINDVNRIYLGLATKRRINTIISNLERIQTLCLED